MDPVPLSAPSSGVRVAPRAKRDALTRETVQQVGRVFTHNLGLKGISLLLACALWFHVNLSSQELVSETFRLPVQLFNLDDHNLTVEMPPASRSVLVTVRGRRSDLIFKQEHIHVGVDLRTVRSPLGEIRLRVETVVPSYFDLQSVEPSTVTVNVKPQAKAREE